MGTLGTSFTPSPASGVTIPDFPSAYDDPVLWILEPQRSPSLNRYSGTMQHPVIGGKLGNTIAAHAHLVYIYSKGDMVIADIQCEYS